MSTPASDGIAERRRHVDELVARANADHDAGLVEEATAGYVAAGTTVLELQRLEPANTDHRRMVFHVFKALGMNQRRLGRLDDAVGAFELAIEAARGHFAGAGEEAHERLGNLDYELGRTLYQARQFELAATHLEIEWPSQTERLTVSCPACASPVSFLARSEADYKRRALPFRIVGSLVVAAVLVFVLIVVGRMSFGPGLAIGIVLFLLLSVVGVFGPAYIKDVRWQGKLVHQVNFSDPKGKGGTGPRPPKR